MSLSRRHLLGALGGAGVAAGAGALLLGQGGQRTQAPLRGGRIRVASIASSTADTLDPAKGGLSTDYMRHNMLYSGLTQYDAQLRAQLALAESISSSDATLWQVKLKRGITFHDGSSLTAQDVAYSLLRHKDPQVATKIKPLIEQFADIRAVGPHELTIRLTGPNIDLPIILADSHLLIIKDGTTDFRTANGTGPYRLKSFQPGVRTIVTKNPNYWREGRPHVEEIELIAIPDEVSRVNALLSGDVHLVLAVNPRSTRRIEATGTHGVLETKSGLFTSLIMRRDEIPTGNPYFVEAMKSLLNRELIQRALYRGYGMLGNDQPIPPTNPYYNADLPYRAYDPERAAWLIRKAGMQGVRLPMWASPAADGSVDMASILQENAAQAGLKLAVNRVPADGYWSNHWMKHPLSFGNTNPRPTADLIFSLFYKSDAPWNESGWKNPQFDQMLLAARAEEDEARRKQIYGDMQEMIHHQAGVGIPVFISLIDGYDKRVKGLGSIPIGGLMGYSFAEHVWLDA